ncbi:hypothetical protein AGLY_013137 [Aphis glycines]|uniref:Uncharacterized protein n=1 Tax=Aphis glycines TaxID=307491 RepID=A0A6G0T7K4_APHGL|nr:hypothetical protein AGLY_013137 [Aphis glycines]
MPTLNLYRYQQNPQSHYRLVCFTERQRSLFNFERIFASCAMIKNFPSYPFKQKSSIEEFLIPLAQDFHYSLSLILYTNTSIIQHTVIGSLLPTIASLSSVSNKYLVELIKCFIYKNLILLGDNTFKLTKLPINYKSEKTKQMRRSKNSSFWHFENKLEKKHDSILRMMWIILENVDTNTHLIAKQTMKLYSNNSMTDDTNYKNNNRKTYGKLNVEFLTDIWIYEKPSIKFSSFFGHPNFFIDTSKKILRKIENFCYNTKITFLKISSN